MNLQIRPIEAEELETFERALSVPFLYDPTPETTDRFTNTFELERLRAAFDGEQMVATFGAFSFQLVVPGNVLPMAGTTIVTVLPTHRRRGVLRALMTEHLAEVHERNEPLATLWASESSIYGRFGYGPATERATMTIDQHFAKRIQDHCQSRLDRVVVPADRVAEHGVHSIFIRARRQPTHQPFAPFRPQELLPQPDWVLMSVVP